MFNQQLLNELRLLRQRLRDAGKKEKGRTPVICKDSVLLEIARFRPKKTEDFACITGIGKTFVEKYGQAFLSVVQKYERAGTENAVALNASVVEILKELEKKLVNINKRNRLLYMPKITSRYACDLYAFGSKEIKGILFGKGKAVRICDTAKNPEHIASYKNIVRLLREVNKDLRDKGQNDLYIAYPFVKGKMTGEDFTVRAPLVLFPVRAEKTPTSIALALDESRDTVFNTTLLLASFKFNAVSKALPDDDVENYTESNLPEQIAAFYAEHGLDIGNECPNVCEESQDACEQENKDKEDFRKFTEYKADEFPKYNAGELFMEHCAVLGKFPLYSGAIQKDFEAILQSGQINSLLNTLLLNSEDIDFYADDDEFDETEELADEELPDALINGQISAEEYFKAKERNAEKNSDNGLMKISETELAYINDLNSSQEMVLSAINELDELVVQGPPGTGKSQVITSLIADFVHKNKTVLMVSEKKTALDVVYSRLGYLSQYALLIDDVGNKDAFYEQLARMVGLEQKKDGSQSEQRGLPVVSHEIELLVSRLENIAKSLYTANELGVEPYKLYIKSKRIDLADEGQREKIRIINQKRDPALLGLTFEQLEKARQTFADPCLTEKLVHFDSIVKAHPWLGDLRETISEYEILDLENKLLTLQKNVQDWQKKNIFSRLFSKGSITEQAKALIKEYFVKTGSTLEDMLLNKTEVLLAGIGHYGQYQAVKPHYAQLSPETQKYMASLLEIKDIAGSLEQANAELYNILLYEHIARFEAKNRMLLQDVENFENIVRSLSEAIGKKKELTRQQLEYILSENIRHIALSKRKNEILRILESKRKWSVNKFLKKFDFELFKSVKIWLLTPEVVSEILPFQNGLFDLVVFDEASQMFVEKGIPSILRAKKVLIAGDHKQLRPSNLGIGRIEMDMDDLPEDTENSGVLESAVLEEESLLDLARFKYQDVMLNFHYRSKFEELIAFSTYAFYKGRLYVSPNAVTPELPPIQVHRMENAVWSNRSNRAEAEYIVAMLKDFFNTRKNNETVGIITFNTNQRDLIEDLLDEACAMDAGFAAAVQSELVRKKDGEDIGLFIKNIESVQGDERDVIIFSIGYAKDENGRFIRNFGWLNQRGGENRLNVAISRSKRKVHIVSSFNPAELQVDDMKNEGPRILKKYLEYAQAISDGNKELARQILCSFGDSSRSGQQGGTDSELENAVCEALTEKGFTVDKHIGIGGYTLDMAIKKGNQYVLGLECDGRLYHGAASTRERDYHRQKYFEARGWKIYRIWSSHWWKDKEAELAKIAELVNAQ